MGTRFAPCLILSLLPFLASCGIGFLTESTNYSSCPGCLDPSFGLGGVAIVDFPGTSDAINAIALQGDKIIAAGTTQPASQKYFAVARLKPDGSLDTAFQANGMTAFRIDDFIPPNTASDNIAFSVAVQADGKIVIGGMGSRTAGPSSPQSDAVVARLDSLGALDTTFGTQGFAITGSDATAEVINALAIRPSDSRILGLGASGTSSQGWTFDSTGAVGAGWSSSFMAGALGGGIALGPGEIVFGAGSKAGDMQAWWFDSNGDPPGPNTGLYASAQIALDMSGAGDTAQAIALHPNADVFYLAGSANGSPSVAAVQTDGALLPTFGNAGKFTFSVPGIPTADFRAALFAQTGELILVGSQTGGPSDTIFAFVVDPAKGGLMSPFGKNGLITAQIAIGAVVRGAALQSDGKLLVAGMAGGKGFVARFLMR